MRRLSGFWVFCRIAFTIPGPNEISGTNRPSMMSMDPVGPGLVDRAHPLGQAAEVGSENRRSDFQGSGHGRELFLHDRWADYAG
jgi:hypothetical protein